MASRANPAIGDFRPLRKADDDMECGRADVEAQGEAGVSVGVGA